MRALKIGLLGSLAGLLLLAAGSGCKLKPANVEDVVQITVDEDGFKPNHFPAKKGRPITLVFNRTVEKTCANAVVIAAQNINQNLPLNTSVPVTFIPEKAGDLHFACPMNMYTGEIEVRP